MSASNIKEFSPLEKAILNEYQQQIPLCSRPFAELAQRFHTCEQNVINTIKQLKKNGLLTRVGPMFDVAEVGGAFTLAAMQVPEAQFDEVAETVNAFEQVAHNYRRQHQLNMWFVIACEQQDEIATVIHLIEQQTGLTVYNFPKQEEFYVGLYLPV